MTHISDNFAVDGKIFQYSYIIRYSYKLSAKLFEYQNNVLFNLK